MALESWENRVLLKALTVEKEIHETFSKTYDDLTAALIRSSSSTLSLPTFTINDSQSQRYPEDQHEGCGSDSGGPSRQLTETLFVQQPLAVEAYSEEDFIVHLMRHRWEGRSRIMLGDLLQDDVSLKRALLFERHEAQGADAADQSYSNIYDVGVNGTILPHTHDCDNAEQAIWRAMKDLNIDTKRLRHTVGRITVLREPRPALLAAAHLILNPPFDMDKIFQVLSSSGVSESHMNQSFEADHHRRGSSYFVLKYHTLVGDGRCPTYVLAGDRCGR